MGGDLGCELLDLIDDLRQRGGVAVGEQADAASEGLGDAVQLHALFSPGPDAAEAYGEAHGR